jgi:CMP-N-acetylneuraminic acid synthetase
VDTINHPYNVREIRADGTARFWQYDLHYSIAGKDRPKFYKAANLWLSSYDTVMKEGKLEGKKNVPLIVADIYSSDIDTKEDLDRIEAILSHFSKNG